MSWTFAMTRRSGRFVPVDVDDENDVINGFACIAEVRAFAIWCPNCGAPYEVRMRDVRSPVFNREKQRFRCRRCRFAAPVRLVVDRGFAPEPPARPTTAA